MKITYYASISLFIHAIIFAQGVDLPTEPVQAPISGLWLLVASGAALAYKKLKKQKLILIDSTNF